MKIKRVVSGIQPSGILHLGNYLGAVKNWVDLQNSNDKKCLFFIADHHSATSNFLIDKNDEIEENLFSNSLNQMVIKTAACLLASGINPKKVILFTQSNISAHSELMWILSCMTPLSWLNKMIQFKEKRGNDKSNTGLYTYPILMAADILLYKGEEVPVGEDQIQHIELTRDIATRLNKLSKQEVVPLPNSLITKTGARVMSLQNGTAKMSKSDKNTHACLNIITTEEEIKNKILKAKTDSLGKIYFDVKNRPELSNLLNIYSQCENLKIEDTVTKFESASTLEFKLELIKSLNNLILPISYKAKNLIEKDFDYVRDVIREGRKLAELEANKNLDEIKSCLNYFV